MFLLLIVHIPNKAIKKAMLFDLLLTAWFGVDLAQMKDLSWFLLMFINKNYMTSLCYLGSVSCMWDPLGVPQSPALRSPLGVLAELVTHLRHAAMGQQRKEH